MIGRTLAQYNIDEQAAPAAATEPVFVGRAYAITGMTWVIHLEEALRALPGIRAVEVSFDERVARVRFESEEIADDAHVLAAVASTGYAASRTEEHHD